jgi:hypothetical protein
MMLCLLTLLVLAVDCCSAGCCVLQEGTCFDGLKNQDETGELPADVSYVM